MPVSIAGPKFYVFDSNGDPVEGALINTYEIDGVTRKETFNGEDGAANSNPVVTNAAGYADVYLDGVYAIVVTDADGVLIWSETPFTSGNELAKDWVNKRSATFASTTSFTIAGNATAVYKVGRRVKLEDATTLYGTITATSYGASVTTVTVSIDDGSVLSASLDYAWVYFLERGDFVDQVANVAALRGISGDTGYNYAYVQSHTSRGDGGHGSFRWVSGAAAGTYVDNNGTIILPTGGDGGAAWIRDQEGHVSVRWFGAKGDNLTNDTSAVQDAIDYVETVRQGVLMFPAGDYRVTQITLGSSGNRLGTTYDFSNANIVGIASTSTTSIVQIKCGSATIRNLAVAGSLNTNYESGVHWYTNDLNTYYPGFNRIQGMKISGCVVGLCVGALPSQADPIPAQGTVQADGVATDAPLSESYVADLNFQDCIKDLYMRQPNGKLTIQGATFTPSNSSWSGSGVSAEANVTAVTVNSEGSELTILGGFLENIDEETGSLADALGGTLNIIGTVLESKSPIRISGRATVRMSNIMNWGLNNASSEFFLVHEDADGELILSDMILQRGYGVSTTTSLLKTVSSLATESFGVNEKFHVVGSQVTLRDANFAQGSTFTPLVRGCRSKFTNSRMVTYDGSGVVQSAYKIDEQTNLLSGKVDLAAKTITAYGVNAAATSGGWTFTVNAAPSWGSESSDLPTIEGVSVTNYLRMTATVGSGFVAATSPKFPVEPSRLQLLRAWVKTGASGSKLIFRLKYYDFGGTASAIDAEFDTYAGTEANFGAVWQPIMLWFVPPADATQAELFLYVENSADLKIADLKIV